MTARGNGPSREFNRIVRRAQAAIATERLWPKFAAAAGAGGLFLTASWAGVWQTGIGQMPEVRMAGVALFAALGVAGLFLRTGPFRDLRGQAVARIDRNAGDPPEHPARILDDRLSADADPVSAELWRVQQNRVEKKWEGKLNAGAPRSALPGLDPYRLRFAIPVLAAVTAFLAGNQMDDRVAQAFDWKTPAPVVEPVQVRAWVTPPEYTGLGDVYLTEGENGKTLAGADDRLFIPEGSVLTILSQDGPVQITRDAGEVPAPKTTGADESGPGGGGQIARYEIKLTPQDKCVAVQNGPRFCFDVKEDKAPVVELNAAEESRKPPGSLEIGCVSTDDYGVESGEVIIEPAKPGAPDAKPLPNAGIPSTPLRGGRDGPCPGK